MIFVDTGAWYALATPSDKDHKRATAFVAANVIQRLKLSRAFAFDEHFRQFGNVAVLPATE